PSSVGLAPAAVHAARALGAGAARFWAVANLPGAVLADEHTLGAWPGALAVRPKDIELDAAAAFELAGALAAHDAATPAVAAVDEHKLGLPSVPHVSFSFTWAT